MRITTQMLNASMRKAGLPVNNMSLLNYINGSSSQSNSLLSALNKNGITTNNKSYEKLKSQAEKLQETMDALSSGELFEGARESKDAEAVLSSAQDMIKRYNDTLKSLKGTTSPLNQYYRQMLLEASKDAEGQLKEIGISIASDGTLSLDADKLKSSDIDQLEEVLGADGSFTPKISFLASRIADNAGANAASASSQYNALGNNYFAASGKYDFWG